MGSDRPGTPLGLNSVGVECGDLIVTIYFRFVVKHMLHSSQNCPADTLWVSGLAWFCVHPSMAASGKHGVILPLPIGRIAVAIKVHFKHHNSDLIIRNRLSEKNL